MASLEWGNYVRVSTFCLPLLSEPIQKLREETIEEN